MIKPHCLWLCPFKLRKFVNYWPRRIYNHITVMSPTYHHNTWQNSLLFWIGYFIEYPTMHYLCIPVCMTSMKAWFRQSDSGKSGPKLHGGIISSIPYYSDSLCIYLQHTFNVVCNSHYILSEQKVVSSKNPASDYVIESFMSCLSIQCFCGEISVCSVTYKIRSGKSLGNW